MATLSEIRAQYPQYADMSDADLASALHRKFYADMPRAEFDKRIGLAPAQAAPEGSGIASVLPRAITDIPGEIASAASSAASAINDNLNPFSEARRRANEAKMKMGFVEGLGAEMRQLGGVGRGLAAIPELIFSPVTGAARSLIGHPMATLDKAIGEVVNPRAAAQRPYEQAYSEWKDAADTAMLAMAPRSVSPVGARTVPAPVPTSQELMSAAKAAYKSPEVTSLRIDPASTNALAATIENDLLKAGFRPAGSSAADTFRIVRDELRSTPKAGYVEVADLDSTRRALSKTAMQRDLMGKPTPEATAAQAAVRHIDDYLTKVQPNDVLAGNAAAASAKLTEARGNYAAGKRSSEIDFRLNKAERQAAKSGSGMNLENARRQKIDQVSDYGLTPEEIALKEKIVLGTPSRNMLRTTGKLGVDGGLSLLLNTGAAIGSGGYTLPITAGGTAARLIGQSLTKRQIRQLNEMIRSRAPLAQAALPQMLPVPAGAFGAVPATSVSAISGGLLGAISETPRSRKGDRIKRRAK